MKVNKCIVKIVFVAAISAIFGSGCQVSTVVAPLETKPVSRSIIKRVFLVEDNKITLEDIHQRLSTYNLKNESTSMIMGGSASSVTRINYFRLGIYKDPQTIVFYDGIPVKDDYVEEIAIEQFNVVILVPANIEKNFDFKQPRVSGKLNIVIISNPDDTGLDEAIIKSGGVPPN
ncbi:MAG: hypothetical protein JXR78_00630 [Victivallales bacterium]|nr:hypothetical protein [Victivallales bacterium]